MSITIWHYVGWALLAIIIIGIGALIYAMVQDTKNAKDKVISLPSLDGMATENAQKVFDKDSEEALSEKKSRSARRAAKNGSGNGFNNNIAQSSSSFFEDDNDDFILPSGKD